MLRLVPGHSAITCAAPITTAARTVIDSSGSPDCSPPFVQRPREQQDHDTADRPRNDDRATRRRAGCVSPFPRRRRRSPPESNAMNVAVAIRRPSGSRPTTPRAISMRRLPVQNDHGEDRTRLDRDRVRVGRILRTRMRADVDELLRHEQVARRADRQELRDALDDAEQRSLDRGQLVLRGLRRGRRQPRQDLE